MLEIWLSLNILKILTRTRTKCILEEKQNHSKQFWRDYLIFNVSCDVVGVRQRFMIITTSCSFKAMDLFFLHFVHTTLNIHTAYSHMPQTWFNLTFKATVCKIWEYSGLAPSAGSIEDGNVVDTTFTSLPWCHTLVCGLQFWSLEFGIMSVAILLLFFLSQSWPF